ncbi:MAG: hypothetical protein P0Y53_08595 [Candidatus Pseudobacter hemicellulosilyticus]|uniref:Uncharacterized protein n=1 Tax=Candidatus Pseudobacter hemicellulosilyticus TaxID=3121375 RepID=A0AAJ5WWM2_9BACT|nr:MAG: hypothetical protein P0Y53_08595 [Pseudobacter sp.]
MDAIVSGRVLVAGGYGHIGHSPEAGYSGQGNKTPAADGWGFCKKRAPAIQAPSYTLERRLAVN